MKMILEIALERKNNSSKHQYCKAGSPWCRCSSYLLAAASLHEIEIDSLGRMVESTLAIRPSHHTGIQWHHCSMPQCCMVACRWCCRTLVRHYCTVSSPCGHVFADQNRMISSTSPRPSSRRIRNHSPLGNAMMMMMMGTLQCCKVEILEYQCNYRLRSLKSHFEYEFGYHHRKIVSTVPSLATHHIHTLLGLQVMSPHLQGSRDLHFHSQNYWCHLEIAREKSIRMMIPEIAWAKIPQMNTPMKILQIVREKILQMKTLRCTVPMQTIHHCNVVIGVILEKILEIA